MSWISIFLFLLWGAAIVCGIAYWIATVRARKQGPKCKRATVLRKDEARYEGYSMPKAVTEVKNDYSITFSIDGKTKAFFAGPGFYQALQAGDKGMLFYQGDRVVDFQKDAQ